LRTYTIPFSTTVSGCARALQRRGHALPIKDPDRKGKVESGVGHAQKTPLKGLRFESLEEAQSVSRTDRAGIHPSMQPRTRQVAVHRSPKKNRPCFLCRWNPSATTSTENAWFISTAVSKSKQPITGYRQDGSDGSSKCNGCAARAILNPPQITSREHSARTRLVSHQKRRLSQEKPLTPPSWLRRQAGRAEHGSAYSVTPSIATKRAWHPSHPGDPLLGQEIRHGGVEDACAAPWNRVPEYRFVRRYLEPARN